MKIAFLDLSFFKLTPNWSKAAVRKYVRVTGCQELHVAAPFGLGASTAPAFTATFGSQWPLQDEAKRALVSPPFAED
jgi:hypothetical protein